MGDSGGSVRDAIERRNGRVSFNVPYRSRHARMGVAALEMFRATMRHEVEPASRIGLNVWTTGSAACVDPAQRDDPY